MEHQERLNNIEAECDELRRQILQLEFQHKKDSVEAEKQFTDRYEKTQRQLDYITRLVGITYEELDLLDDKIIESGSILTKPRKRVK